MPDKDSSGPPPAPQPLLRLTRYRLRFRERGCRGQSALRSPRSGYLGSAWRGAFGHALKQSLCVTGLPDCGACALVHSCAYPFVFESRTPPDAQKLRRYPHTPNPYVLEPADQGYDSDGETINLGFALFGQANGQITHVVQALKLAARSGLTAQRVQLDLLDVQAESPSQGWEAVHDLGNGLGAIPSEPVPPAPAALKIQLISPLRMRRKERLVGTSEFDFRAFAGNLLRRLSLLTHFFGEAPLETDFVGLLRQAERVPIANSTLRWREWGRYSSRQDAEIPMGGLIGAFEIASPELAPFWPCLWLGQWTHIGKGCTMGLGRYALAPTSQGAGRQPQRLQWPAPSRL